MVNTVSKPCSSSLRQFADLQDLVYQKKLDEKLRAFFSLSSGKASWVADLLSAPNVELLKANRMAVWTWVHSGCIGDAPLLPTEFPDRFFVVKFGPICVGAGSAPTLKELLPDAPEIVGTSLRKVSAGEYMLTVSLVDIDFYMSLSKRLNLRKSEWYEESFWGPLLSKQYGSVPVSLSVTTLSIIATSHNNGLMGETVSKLADFPPAKSHVETWLDSELSLIDVSIISAAACAASQSSLRLRRDVLYPNLSPHNACWRGDVSKLKLPASLGGARLAHRLGLGVGALSSSRAPFQFLQTWLASKVPSTRSGDPGPEDAYGRLHFLLATCMEKQEELGVGTVSKDLQTPISNLSLYDPLLNPNGVFLCPTYLPSHAIRLCEWFESSLPELEEGNIHFLHIDGEGEFYQLHTETGGCIMAFTGMGKEVEKELLKTIGEKFRHFDFFQNTLVPLSNLVKSICREFTLSRHDVVFGGDRAGCPIASQSIKTRMNEKYVPWIESDISNWYWFIEGVPGVDFFLTRSIDPTAEESAVAGFKNLVDSAPGRLAGETCICKRVFGPDWLRQCSLTHPQMWHGYPQSGAGRFKNLTEPCHWTILYYAVADLIKARSLTFTQQTVSVELVTPETI